MAETKLKSQALSPNTDHIVLTPGTSKLVKIAVLEQADTTNTYRNNAIILTGWGFKNGNGAGAAYMTDAVSFGLTFSTAPIVVVSGGGRSTAGSGASDGLGSSWNEPVTAAWGSISTSGFNAVLLQTQGTNFSNYDYLYTWIAIGTLT